MSQRNKIFLGILVFTAVVFLGRCVDAAELAATTRTTNGTNELLMRNQFRAWAKYMTPPAGSAS